MATSIVQQAHGLAQAGRATEALALLGDAIAAGNPDAKLLLALWKIEGSVLPRDLPGARDLLQRAAAGGQLAAARIEAALGAVGVGLPRDWRGALALLGEWAGRDPVAARQLALLDAMDIDADGNPGPLPAAEPLSAAPSVAHSRGLFSANECAFLIDQAANRFHPARIFHEGQQRFVVDPVRDSENAAFPLISESPLIHALNRRIAAVSDSNVAQAETLQLLRYQPGQQYRLHVDAVPGLANQRIRTVLIYLNADYDGGTTRFPDLGIDYRGGVGDALIFSNVLPDGRPDPRTRHSGQPVTRGVKFVASRWIRQRPPPEGETFGPHEAAPAAA